MLSKLQTNRGVSWGFAPQLCGKALPFRPKAPIFLLIRPAGRLRLPAGRMRCIDGTIIGKAEPFRTASGEAAGHPSIAGSNFDKPGVKPPLRQTETRPAIRAIRHSHLFTLRFKSEFLTQRRPRIHWNDGHNRP